MNENTDPWRADGTNLNFRFGTDDIVRALDDYREAIERDTGRNYEFNLPNTLHNRYLRLMDTTAFEGYENVRRVKSQSGKIHVVVTWRNARRSSYGVGVGGEIFHYMNGGWCYDAADKYARVFKPNVGSCFKVARVPSDTLLSVIAGFHETLAVDPLVDLLLEEYPDEMTPILAGCLT